MFKQKLTPAQQKRVDRCRNCPARIKSRFPVIEASCEVPIADGCWITTSIDRDECCLYHITDQIKRLEEEIEKKRNIINRLYKAVDHRYKTAKLK